MNSLSAKLATSLLKMYGDLKKKVVRIWSTEFSLKGGVAASILSFLSESLFILKEHVEEHRIRRIVDFVNTDGATKEEFVDYTTELEFGFIHGDLNCDNVLLGTGDDLVLIDFLPRSLKFVLRDPAKLERDLVFKVMDAETSSFFDWGRLEEWQAVLNTLDGKLFLEFHEDQFQCCEPVLRIVRYIYSLRSQFESCGFPIERRNYLVSLLYFAILVLAHPAISIQKKVFGVMYVDAILDELESWPLRLMEQQRKGE